MDSLPITDRLLLTFIEVLYAFPWIAFIVLVFTGAIAARGFRRVVKEGRALSEGRPAPTGNDRWRQMRMLAIWVAVSGIAVAMLLVRSGDDLRREWIGTIGLVFIPLSLVAAVVLSAERRDPGLLYRGQKSMQKFLYGKTPVNTVLRGILAAFMVVSGVIALSVSSFMLLGGAGQFGLDIWTFTKVFVFGALLTYMSTKVYPHG